LFDAIASTMDVAHDLAATGAPIGTLVLAERQTAGRGRGGRGWVSRAGCGIWLTMIDRPRDASTAAVLTIRLGLHLAHALDPFAESEIGLKWPNDLIVGGGKLAGVLAETRWQEQRPVWSAIGVGINVEPPPPEDVPHASGLRPGTSRVAVLDAAVAGMRRAFEVEGPLIASELAQFARRDIARGRRCSAPGEGWVEGIGAGGELLVSKRRSKSEEEGQGDAGVHAYRSGSLVLDGEVATP
jgi:BirA family biotin operon repressor/biotin-[acetyl-CoA-carboxylase] ligase